MKTRLRRCTLAVLLAALCLPAPPAAPGWASSADEVTITLVGDVGLNRSNQPVEPEGVRRGDFQTWAETTSLIDDEINGDLNFMNVETVVTDRNDLTARSARSRARRSTSARTRTASAISCRAASICCRSPTITRWTTASKG